MKKSELQTPAILVDLDVMQQNITNYQGLCDQYSKLLWPMIKTHKSTEIVRLQESAGATGFLAGTLDECDALCRAGVENVMYAYPVATEVSAGRIVDFARRSKFVARIDGKENAEMLNVVAGAAGVSINCTVIVDSGLHRFGILPQYISQFVRSIQELSNIQVVGISSHPGHVYGATSPDQVPKYVEDEKLAMRQAADSLRESGLQLEIISSGSTPTFRGSVSDEVINIYHPGNYVFHDVIQNAAGASTEDECALTVLASVISHPREDLFIIDAGSKCLGLDQGAHGNTAIVGFGKVKGYPELIVQALSEEVGKIVPQGETSLRVGDSVEIIPNHACVSANMTNFLVGCRGDEVVREIEVDMRENSRHKSS